MKHSNPFWHEGVKIFEERMLETAKGQLRIRHLENDVTKALLNVFEHGTEGVLHSFLRLVGVSDAPASFQYDFQVTDTEAYRRQPRRMMLCIIADSTQVTSNPSYSVDTSRPDGCIFNERTAILIEVKTQSPLVEEQIEGHIRCYLGSATERRTSLTGWTALYLHDGDPDLHVNHYPNINFNFHTGGIELSLNGEVRPSLKLFLAKMKEDPERFDALVRALPGMRLALYYKLQYRPLDNFRWKFLPGYPMDVREVHAADSRSDIARMKQDWEKHRRTFLFEMENGLLLSRAGRPLHRHRT